MSLSSMCPKCSTSSPVPEEMVGKKVRCKKCQNIFVVEVSKSSSKSVTRPASKAALSSSSGTRKKEQKSNGLLWLSLTVVTLLVFAGGGVGFYFMNQPEPKVAKAKIRKEDPTPVKSSKDPVDKKGSKDKGAESGGKENPKGKGQNNDPEAKNPPVKNPPKNAPPETKMTEPVLVAKLLNSSPTEIAQLQDIQDMLPAYNNPLKVALKTMADGQPHFEMYDLKKQERIAKFKMEKNVVLWDIDPDATILVTADDEKRLNFYSLPDGALLEDDWAPYDNNRDEIRFLGSGKMLQVALVSRNLVWVFTTRGNGDLWDWTKKKSEYFIPPLIREDYRKEAVGANRDFVLSPDRGQYALATDEGIQFHETKTGKKIGNTQKLSKYGSKAELISIGFEVGGKKLAAYFSVGKDSGRVNYHARFNVPGGEEIFLETGSDPGVLSGLEFVNDDFFLILDRRLANLHDGKGKSVAQCGFPGKFGLFASRPAGTKLAYAYKTEKDKPFIGLVEVPLATAAPAVVDTKGKSLEELLGVTANKGGKDRVFENEEIWEFSSQGILKKGVRSYAKK